MKKQLVSKIEKIHDMIQNQHFYKNNFLVLGMILFVIYIRIYHLLVF